MDICVIKVIFLVFFHLWYVVCCDLVSELGTCFFPGLFFGMRSFCLLPRIAVAFFLFFVLLTRIAIALALIFQFFGFAHRWLVLKKQQFSVGKESWNTPSLIKPQWFGFFEIRVLSPRHPPTLCQGNMYVQGERIGLVGGGGWVMGPLPPAWCHFFQTVQEDTT